MQETEIHSDTAAVVRELVEALVSSQALLEIANSVADELTFAEHTTGISDDAKAVLRDYDGLFHATRMANKAAIAKATGGAA